ncbi:hypothetical protein Ac2012v2_002527 [Leucoagaricus gongylophorus]
MAHSSDSEKSIFLSHIVSQVENDVGFLARQGYISQEDASSFLAKLPRSNTLAHASVPTFPTPIPTPHAAAFSSTHASAVPRARVLWAWTGQDSGDLNIAQGDTIDIIEETNKDWWTGRIADRQGLFPANYVEKIQASTSINEKPIYRPFRAAFHGMDHPPTALAPMPGPSAQSNSLGLQQAPGQEDKKGKYDDLKKTMAHSAAGGVGFGAGAAIGSGFVNAIF